MTEQEYDELIAPKLVVIGEKIRGMGGSLICRVEWNNGKDDFPEDQANAGSISAGVTTESSVGHKLVYMAAKANGNVDSLFIGALRELDCSQTILGKLIGNAEGNP